MPRNSGTSAVTSGADSEDHTPLAERAGTRAMNLRLPEHDAKELELVAEIEGQSIAAIIRNAIRAHLDTLAEDDDFKARSRALLEQHTSILQRYAG